MSGGLFPHDEPCQLPLFVDGAALWWGVDRLGDDFDGGDDRERLLHRKFAAARKDLDGAPRPLFVDIVYDGVADPVQVGFFDSQSWLLDGHHRAAVAAVIGAFVPLIFGETVREREWAGEYPWYCCDWGPWARDEVSDGSWMHDE